MYWYGVTVNEDDVRTVLGFLAAEAYRPSHDIQAIILRRLVTELQSGDASRNHDWLSQPHFDRLKQWCSTQTTEKGHRLERLSPDQPLSWQGEWEISVLRL